METFFFLLCSNSCCCSAVCFHPFPLTNRFPNHCRIMEFQKKPEMLVANLKAHNHFLLILSFAFCRILFSLNPLPSFQFHESQ